jgi:hypothetical protein
MYFQANPHPTGNRSIQDPHYVVYVITILKKSKTFLIPLPASRYGMPCSMNIRRFEGLVVGTTNTAAGQKRPKGGIQKRGTSVSTV